MQIAGRSDGGLTDEKLMIEVRSGNVRQLGALFDRHHGSLFRYSMRMTGNREWSEDLVQEIFCRILRYRDTFRDGHLFTTWMFRIARNTFVDHTRKRRWEVQKDDTMDTPVMPENVLEQEQDLDLLRQALLRLPDQQRELLVLARFQQMPYTEIATLLDVEVGTVKTRVHRALKSLRDIYLELSAPPVARPAQGA